MSHTHGWQTDLLSGIIGLGVHSKHMEGPNIIYSPALFCLTCYSRGSSHFGTLPRGCH